MGRVSLDRAGQGECFLQTAGVNQCPQKRESANPVKKLPIQNTKRCSENTKLRGDVKGRRDG